MTEALAPVIQSLELQAGVCAQMGSPFSASVARAVAADIAAGGAFAELAAPWAGKDVRRMFADATPLRFLGGLHFLVLNGDAPELAEVYPPAGGDVDPSRLAALVSATGRRHRDFFSGFLTSPPQTNEVNRSVCLSAGFMVVAKRSGLPLRCLEIGASAGLNLNWDRYHYDVGEAGVWGDPASPVRLAAEWTGEPPSLDVLVRVVDRRGCDQNPIDVSDHAQAQRLKAYVWPDQLERMQRLAGAIEMAQRHRPPVDKADAADWARSHGHGAPGTATVLYHSIVWSYLPDETQAGVRAAIESAGESASADAPFAWLRMEPNPNDLAA
ncbi:MAG TPA: DUF2332 domain-containing protein, partial [Caulobacteraceae bacterium]|nr:DUF2332 domain-containing protein [Caulobacteraceae bacterium]